ncbi:hypothetical protein BHE74_00039092 [Ensete ventricosum]|nr:hypothetical protein BHE74_00039092 [Ensete ventricosum]
MDKGASHLCASHLQGWVLVAKLPVGVPHKQATYGQSMAKLRPRVPVGGPLTYAATLAREQRWSPMAHSIADA